MMRQQIARVGDLQLESGDVIYNCRIGYRTKGRLNASTSNGVLVIPWFEGTSGNLARQLGPGRLVDISKYFTILVDPLGNGVSSSPSNGRRQRDAHFPRFSIRDVVASQHRLVNEVLGLHHLAAVIGLSMGGMLVFQRVTSHPHFMDKGISIVGSPQAQADDRRRWESLVARLTTESVWRRAGKALSRLAARTVVRELRMHAHDHIRQGEAIMCHDISAPFGGSMERAAAAIRADLLVVGTWRDEEVNPAPAFELARMIRAEVLELDGRCGHQAPRCEQTTLWRAVEKFLAGTSEVHLRARA
jgi:homoserine O-acetyltransferase/O-succinyltransferase